MSRSSEVVMYSADAGLFLKHSASLINRREPQDFGFDPLYVSTSCAFGLSVGCRFRDLLAAAVEFWAEFLCIEHSLIQARLSGFLSNFNGISLLQALNLHTPLMHARKPGILKELS
jgi:hypothetical protein